MKCICKSIKGHSDDYCGQKTYNGDQYCKICSNCHQYDEGNEGYEIMKKVQNGTN